MKTRFAIPIGIAVALLALASVAMPAQADVPTECNVPTDYATIQDALDAETNVGTEVDPVWVPTCDIINVAAGTYAEDLFIDHSVELIGTDAVIEWVSSGSVVFVDALDVHVAMSGFTINGPTTGVDYVYGIEWSDSSGTLTLDDMEINTGYSAVTVYGLPTIVGATDLTITNSELTSAVGIDDISSSDSTIIFDSAGDLSISDSSVTQMSDDYEAILVSTPGGSTISVLDNAITSSYAGIDVARDGDCGGEGVIGCDSTIFIDIHGNTFTSAFQNDDAVYLSGAGLEGAWDISITGSDEAPQTFTGFDDVVRAVNMGSGTEFTVRGNTISGHGNAAVEFTAHNTATTPGFDIDVSFNTITDGRSEGIDIEFSSDSAESSVWVEGNTLSFIEDVAIEVDADYKGTVTVIDNIISVTEDEGIEIDPEGDGATVTIQGNVLSQVGINFDPESTSHEAGIEIDTHDFWNVIVHGNTIDGTGDEGMEIEIDDHTTLTVTQNEINNTGEHGIEADTDYIGTTMLIEDNILSFTGDADSSYDGMNIDIDEYTHLTVKDNQITDAGEHGIQVSDGYDDNEFDAKVFITGNTVTFTGYLDADLNPVWGDDGIHAVFDELDYTSMEIHGNTIQGAEDGIYALVYDSSRLDVRFNDVNGSREDGIDIGADSSGYGSAFYAMENTVSNSTRTAIDIYAGDGLAFVQDNIIRDSGMDVDGFGPEMFGPIGFYHYAIDVNADVAYISNNDAEYYGGGIFLAVMDVGSTIFDNELSSLADPTVPYYAFTGDPMYCDGNYGPFIAGICLFDDSYYYGGMDVQATIQGNTILGPHSMGIAYDGSFDDEPNEWDRHDISFNDINGSLIGILANADYTDLIISGNTIVANTTGIIAGGYDVYDAYITGNDITAGGAPPSWDVGMHPPILILTEEEVPEPEAFVGIMLMTGYDYLMAAEVAYNTISGSDSESVGIYWASYLDDYFEDSNFHDNTMDTGIGFLLDVEVGFEEYQTIENYPITFNDLSSTEIAFASCYSVEYGDVYMGDELHYLTCEGPVSNYDPDCGPACGGTAEMNYFGPAGPSSDLSVEGIGFEPFLTAAPDVNRAANDAVQTFGYFISSPAGMNAVGIPGASTLAVDDMFVDGLGFEGIVYMFDSETQSWVQAIDQTPGALEGLLVISDEDQRILLDYIDATIPYPVSADVGGGWQFVGARQFSEAYYGMEGGHGRYFNVWDMFNSFGEQHVDNHGDVWEVVNYPTSWDNNDYSWEFNGGGEFYTDTFELYDYNDYTQFEDCGPVVSPYAAYFVEADSHGIIGSSIPAGVTQTELGTYLVDGNWCDYDFMDEAHDYTMFGLDDNNDGVPNGLEYHYSVSDNSVDNDGDGLSNFDEIFLYNTDPDNGDSDWDDLSDFEEVHGLDLGGFEHGFGPTNPNDGDTDGDGLEDAFEVRGGYDLDDHNRPVTNPNHWDTDGDLLSDFDEHVYYYTDPTDTDSDGDGLDDYQEVYGMDQFWVDHRFGDTNPNSAHSDSTEGYANGDELDDYDELNGVFNGAWTFRATNPNTMDTDEDGVFDHVEMENSPATNPNDGDSDNDGIPDGWETEYYMEGCLDPTLPDEFNDCDDDGLTNLQEYQYVSPMNPFATVEIVEELQGTNPLNPDTDGDNLMDGDEAAGCLNSFDGESYMDSEEDALPSTDGKCRSAQNEGTTTYDLGQETDALAADSDEDGLNDGAEVLAMNNAGTASHGYDVTNPWNEDSDGDGIEDGDEIAGCRNAYTAAGGAATVGTPADECNQGSPTFADGGPTDPRDTDSDDDGASDYAEVTGNGISIATNPNSDNTDGDGQPDAWELQYATGEPICPNPAVADNDADCDNDGLTNNEEYVYTSTVATESELDPTDSDTDDDGLFDGAEVDATLNDLATANGYTSTDALVADTDGDGLLDGDEVDGCKNAFTTAGADSTAGAGGAECYSATDTFTDGLPTDPNMADTDDDGLTDGAEAAGTNNAGSSHTFGATNPNVQDGDSDGILDGNEVSGCRNAYAWDSEEATWVDAIQGASTDSECTHPVLETTYTNGQPTDPNNMDSDEDTLEDGDEVAGNGVGTVTNPNNADTDFDGANDNVELTATYAAGAMTDPLDPDTDADTIPDGWEIDNYVITCVDPTVDDDTNDCDADNLDNLGEYTAGSDPALQDTDGDGLWDGTEVNSYSSDPTLASSPATATGVNDASFGDNSAAAGYMGVLSSTTSFTAGDTTWPVLIHDAGATGTCGGDLWSTFRVNEATQVTVQTIDAGVGTDHGVFVGTVPDAVNPCSMVTGGSGPATATVTANAGDLVYVVVGKSAATGTNWEFIGAVPT